MAKENNTNNPKKPRFSSWWIYGVVLVLILGFQFLSSSAFSSTEKTTTSELQEYLRNGDIEKIIVIKNMGQAKVFLTKAALEKKVHAKVNEKPLIPSTGICLLYTSPSPRDGLLSRMPSSA